MNGSLRILAPATSFFPYLSRLGRRSTSPLAQSKARTDTPPTHAAVIATIFDAPTKIVFTCAMVIVPTSVWGGQREVLNALSLSVPAELME